MGFIYQIKNDINDKIYVGKTTRIEELVFANKNKHKNKSNNR